MPALGALRVELDRARAELEEKERELAVVMETVSDPCVSPPPLTPSSLLVKKTLLFCCIIECPLVHGCVNVR